MPTPSPNTKPSRPASRVADYVHKTMPTFIYMDDYQTFVGSAQLDEVQKHEKGRIANQIMTQLGQPGFTSVDKGTVTSFRKVIDAINTVVDKWHQKH